MSNIYAIYDKKAMVYSPIFVASNDEVAKRNCASMVNAAGNTYSDFPSDFSLYLIANISDNAFIVPNGMAIDPSDSSIEGSYAPRHIVDFEQLVAKA